MRNLLKKAQGYSSASTPYRLTYWRETVHETSIRGLLAEEFFDSLIRTCPYDLDLLCSC